MKKTTDNSGKTARPRGRPFPPGVSGNPAGAPKRGESWAELFNAIGDLTGEEISERAVRLWQKTFKSLPKGVTLKELVVIRAYAALLDESNARLLKEVMDRAEGKITDKIELSGKEYKVTLNKNE